MSGAHAFWRRLCALISITRLLLSISHWAKREGTERPREFATTRLVKRAVQLILTAGGRGRGGREEEGERESRRGGRGEKKKVAGFNRYRASGLLLCCVCIGQQSEEVRNVDKSDKTRTREWNFVLAFAMDLGLLLLSSFFFFFFVFRSGKLRWNDCNALCIVR